MGRYPGIGATRYPKIRDTKFPPDGGGFCASPPSPFLTAAPVLAFCQATENVDFIHTLWNADSRARGAAQEVPAVTGGASKPARPREARRRDRAVRPRCVAGQEAQGLCSAAARVGLRLPLVRRHEDEGNRIYSAAIQLPSGMLSTAASFLRKVSAVNGLTM